MTDWGIRDRVIFENRVGLVHRVMPNARFFTVPVLEGGWTEFLLFLVPVDDESHVGYGILIALGAGVLCVAGLVLLVIGLCSGAFK